MCAGCRHVIRNKRAKIAAGGRERKEGPREGRVDALIWAVCIDLHGPVENSTRESCGGVFLRSWCSISIATLRT
jgi:hypothetical protein